MAIALGNMYHDDVDVDVEHLAGVLAAASILQFDALVKGYSICHICLYWKNQKTFIDVLCGRLSYACFSVLLLYARC